MACRVDKIVQTGVMELPRAVTWQARQCGVGELGGRAGVTRQTVVYLGDKYVYLNPY